MNRKRSLNVTSNTNPSQIKPNYRSIYKEARGDSKESYSSTQYFQKDSKTGVFKKFHSEEIKKMKSNKSVASGSSETFHCVHGPDGKELSEEEQLKMFFLKEVDPILIDQSWADSCPLTVGWDLAKTLEFMVKDPIANQQIDRLQSNLKDLAQIAKFGYKIYILDNLCVIMDYLVEKLSKSFQLKDQFILLLRNMEKPILLNVNSDVVTYSESLSNYLQFMGYLLIRLEEDDHFDIVSRALVWHLSAPDYQREGGALRLCHTLASATGLCVTAARMLSLSIMHRFPKFLEIALLLACDNIDNCISMMKENVIEHIFYRFNPYFPDRALPIYEINPADPQDMNLKLGASSKYISPVLSVLLVLLKTTKELMDEDPKFCSTLPCPDEYSQRCFAWAYRYECRARDHRHERITLTIVLSSLLHCFGGRLEALCSALMADILSLSVQTELPLRQDWTGSVNFNTGKLDVHFKQALLYLSVAFFKTFPYNNCLMELRHWLLGVMYLLDPVLCKLRAHWSPPLFANLRITAFKVLICTLPITSPKLVQENGLIRRLMWYIEWYSTSPYDLSVLYWCLGVLSVAIIQVKTHIRQNMLKDLFDSHGIIILIRLCHCLLDKKSPPVEKSQVIISLCLKLLTSALEVPSHISCCVYPDIKRSTSVETLETRMLNVVLNSLHKHLIISDRWIISLLNFLWEAIIWNDLYRAKFVADDGVYKLLDLISMTGPPVQCLALAVLCDVARAGDAVGQMVTWRASSTASAIIPNLVRRGATVANLLAAIFRDECLATGVMLDDSGVIQSLDCPLMSPVLREQINNPNYKSSKYFSGSGLKCLPVAELAGSRMSKVYAILHMLSKDLAFKVSLADEAYNLYRNIKLPPQDETILALSSHYLTLKLSESWIESKILCPDLLPQEDETLKDFSQMSYGWAREIKKMQGDIVEKSNKEDHAVECSFYEFLSRVRLRTALDALREVRCMARSSDRLQISHSLLHDAVAAQKRRFKLSEELKSPIKKTYTSPLDAQNIIGQHIKVTSIEPKQKAVDTLLSCICHQYTDNKCNDE